MITLIRTITLVSSGMFLHATVLNKRFSAIWFLTIYINPKVHLIFIKLNQRNTMNKDANLYGF